jgi:2-hydroxychromene-2-carboxylate isomerase
LLWDGAVDQWHEGDHLKDACHRAGLEWSELSSLVSARPDYYEQQLQVNADALTAVGHWGVPTMVYGQETFFGQDRIDVLAWSVRQHSTT